MERESNQFKSLVERLEEKESIKREMLLNDSYIKWLEHFTKEFPDFNHDSWLYSPEEISKEDYENVIKITEFYEIIDEYANNNYIYLKDIPSGGYYAISYNSVLYQIYVIIGQGTVFGCNRVESEEEIGSDTISYEDIKENRDSERKIFIDEKIEELSTKISKLIEAGIPIEAIEDCIKKLKVKKK